MWSVNHVMRDDVHVGGGGGMVSETGFCYLVEALLVFCVAGCFVYRETDLKEEST